VTGSHGATMAEGQRDDYFGSMQRRGLRLVSTYGWLLGLYPIVQGIVTGEYRPAWLAAGALILFVTLYVVVFLPVLGIEYPAGLRAWVLAAFAALVLAAALGFGGIWLLLVLYLSATCGMFLPPRWNISAIAAVIAAAGAIAFWRGETTGDILGFLSGTLAVGMLNIYMARMRGLIRELRETREELALIAVEAERLRFARDLHDLLGHTLSLIVVKAEAVRRLSERGDSAAAAGQAADIEAVGRRALAEVREAVTGYRERSLTSELDSARSALSDAGIEVAIHISSDPLPAHVDALFGRAVREAATNVIRHSRARRCEIDVCRRDGEALLEVRDDGTGTGTAGSGSGLAGLAEQTSGAGGRLQAGPLPGGGFQFVIAVPA
jgi:two-component system sensor histidine kinase DesK